MLCFASRAWRRSEAGSDASEPRALRGSGRDDLRERGRCSWPRSRRSIGTVCKTVRGLSRRVVPRRRRPVRRPRRRSVFIHGGSRASRGQAPHPRECWTDDDPAVPRGLHRGEQETDVELGFPAGRPAHAARHHCMCFFLGRVRCRSVDWHHLDKKCRETLNTALNNRHVRNAVLESLLPLLWYGNVNGAIAYLGQIDPKHIKSSDAIQRLVGYFERHRGCIPCYAARKKLGLRNSATAGRRPTTLWYLPAKSTNG